MSIRNTLTKFGEIIKKVSEESNPYDVRPVLSRETPDGGQICIPCVVSAIEKGEANREDVSLNILSLHHETHLRGLLDYVENKGGDSRDSR